MRHLIRVVCEDKSTAKSVDSVPQSLSLGCAEPAPFTQGSRNKILCCDKISLAKIGVTGFCAAYAASVRRVAARYGCGSMNFVQISRADNIRLYRALFRYSLLLITLSEAS